MSLQSLGEAYASSNLAVTLTWGGRQAKPGDSTVHSQGNSHRLCGSGTDALSELGRAGSSE